MGVYVDVPWRKQRHRIVTTSVRGRLGVLLAVTALALAACGGDDNANAGGATATPPSS